MYIRIMGQMTVLSCLFLFSALFTQTDEKNGSNMVCFQNFQLKAGRMFSAMDRPSLVKISIATNKGFQGALRFEAPPRDNKGAPHWTGCDIFPVTGTNAFDLNPDSRMRELFLWIYAIPFNNRDNPVNVRIYDTGLHASRDDKVEQWFREKAVPREWTRLSLPLEMLPATLNLHSIRKMQVVFYWPGIYYIRNTGSSRCEK